MYRNYRLFRVAIDGKPFLAKVEHDELEESPLDNFENDTAAPVLVCGHSRYTLGTKDGLQLIKEQIRQSPQYRASWEELTLETPSGGYYENKHFLDFDSLGDLARAAFKCGFLVLPLYLYDHSGITMSTTPFPCRWDSGQVGFIAWSKEARQKWHSAERKRNSQKCKEADLEIMRSIVGEYDQYLTGEVYYISLLDAAGNEENAIGGVFGHKYASEQVFYDQFGADKDSIEELNAALETALAA